MMKIPPHPGLSVQDACLGSSGLSVTEVARFLGVTRLTLSRVVNGHLGISPEMAVRLELAGWSTAGQWLRLQLAYELAVVRAGQDDLRLRGVGVFMSRRGWFRFFFEPQIIRIAMIFRVV